MDNVAVSYANSITFSMENSKALPSSLSTSSSSCVLQAASESAVAAVLLNSLHAGGMSEDELKDAILKCAASATHAPAPSAVNVGTMVAHPNETYPEHIHISANIHAGLEVTDPTDILCPTYKRPTTLSTPLQSSSP